MTQEGAGQPRPGPPDARHEEVPPERSGTRLDQFLAEILAISRAQARRLLEQGQVTTAEGRPLGLRDKGSTIAEGDQFVI
jgi:RNA-binding protein YlmH